MANITPIVGWICAEPMLMEAAAAMLEGTREDASSVPLGDANTCLGRIGSAGVFVTCPQPQSCLGDALAAGRSMAERFFHIQAIVVTGFATRESLAGDASPGDLVISPATAGATDSGARTAANVVQRAIDLLRGEVGEDAYWLSSNPLQGTSSAGVPGSDGPTDDRGSETPSYTRLHYCRDFKGMKDIGGSDVADSRLWNTRTPTVVVLAVAGIHSGGNNIWKISPSQNAASYAKELIQLIADPSTIEIPSLEGTEKLVPPRPGPKLPPFPLHQYPTHGSAVLLVIPTENKHKQALLHECLAERAPGGLTVHTVTVLVESGVGEQPYNEAGAVGAYNRISNALNCLHGEKFVETFIKKEIGAVIAASIESYIQTEDIDRPADFGIAVVHNATSRQTRACSSWGVTVPPEYVSRAQRFSSDGDPNHGNVTVGQILAARVPGLDKADWQVLLARRSRYELLRDAIRELPIPW